MNGKQAKRIRRQVYGDDYSPRFRRYVGVNRKAVSFGIDRVVNQVGTIGADKRRQAYQKMKKQYTRRK